MFLIRVFQNERFNRFLRFFASLINNDGTFTAREHVMGKSETLNVLSCDARGFLLQLKIGRRGVLELAGLFRLRTRTFEAKNCQAVSADAVFCYLNIFVENVRTNA